MSQLFDVLLRPAGGLLLLDTYRSGPIRNYGYTGIYTRSEQFRVGCRFGHIWRMCPFGGKKRYLTVNIPAEYLYRVPYVFIDVYNGLKRGIPGGIVILV